MKIWTNLEKFIIILVFIIIGTLKLIEINNRLIKEKHIPIYSQTFFNRLIEFLNTDTELNHYFIPKKEGKVDSIYLKIGTYQNKHLSCQVKVNLYELGNKNNLQFLTNSSLNCKEINDNQFNKFILKKNVNLIKNKKYLLKINIKGNKKDYLAFYYFSKDDPQKKLFTIDKTKSQKKFLNGELAIFIEKKDITNKSFLYSMISFLLFLSLIFIYFFTNKLSSKKPLFKLVFLFLIGFLWLMIIPPFHGLDEHEHFTRVAEISSFHISSARYNNQFSDYYEGYKNLIDNTLWKADFLSENIKSETINSFDINLGKKTQTGFTLASGYNPFSHLHFAIIMRILETFKLRPIIIFYLLRFVNLVLFLSLIYLTIKIIPKFENFIFLLATFPGIISQATIISTDSIITASIIYCFFFVLSGKKKHSLIEKLFLLFSLFYISFTKYVYSIIGIITVIVLIISSRKKSILKFAYILAAISLIFFINIYWLKYINYNPKNKDIRFENTNPQKQIIDIKKNPINYFATYNNYSLNNLIGRIEMSFFSLSNNYRQITTDIYLSNIAVIIFILISLNYALKIKNSKLNFFYVVLFIFSSYLIAVFLNLIFNISYQTLAVPNRYFGFYGLIPISLGYLFKKFYRIQVNFDLTSTVIFINILNLIITFNLFLPLWFN